LLPLCVAVFPIGELANGPRYTCITVATAFVHVPLPSLPVDATFHPWLQLPFVPPPLFESDVAICVNVAGFTGAVVLELLYANTTNKSPACTDEQDAILLLLALHVVTRLSADTRLIPGSHQKIAAATSANARTPYAALLVFLGIDIRLPYPFMHRH
jgi:hypothetical protein